MTISSKFYFIVGKIDALDTIWIIGDMALSTAGVQFKKKHDMAAQFSPSVSSQSYISNRYDVKLMYSPVTNQTNILLWIINGLYQGFNRYTYLPRFIIIFLDADFEWITHNHDLTYKTLLWLISQVVWGAGKKKSKLPLKARRSTQPKFVLVKPSPKVSYKDIRQEHKFKKRTFNRCAEEIICKYNDFFIIIYQPSEAWQPYILQPGWWPIGR